MVQHADVAHVPRPGAARSRRSVLVVDDENGARTLISRWLEADGYAVASASGADEALSLMESSQPAVALCDICMPDRDGLWLADRIREQHPDTAVVMATGMLDAAPAVAELGDGIVDHLTKPFDQERLCRAVVRGVEWHRAARASRSWRARLDAEVADRHARLAAAIREVRIDSDRALDAMLATLMVGEGDAYGHALRVAAMAVAIAEGLRLPADAVADTRRAALLHDLGKLVMPEAVLRKPAPLTRDEEAVARRQPLLGAQLVEGLPYLAAAAAAVLATRERLDGLGYPSGLTGQQLPIAARIVAAADAYDTMVTPRVFRDPLSVPDALVELDRCAGTQFDPQVVAILKQLVAVH